MSVVLLAAGLVLLALPAALGPTGARLPPAEWCRAVVVCLRVGLLAVHGALALAALPVALGAIGAHGAAHACHPLVAGDLLLPPAAGWLAAAALLASVALGVAARRHTAAVLGRLRAEPWLGRHRVEEGIDEVTLPCVEQVAYAVPAAPGRPGQVVVSDGLLTGLDAQEVQAVLRHERAHLRHGHHAALALARDVEARLGWFPPARASARALRLAIERWADEDAGAASASGRPAVRTALLKAAGLVAAGPVPAFTDVGTIAARLRALATTPQAPTRRDRITATAPIIVLVALAVVGLAVSVVVAQRGLHGVFGHGHAGHDLGHFHAGHTGS